MPDEAAFKVKVAITADTRGIDTAKTGLSELERSAIATGKESQEMGQAGQKAGEKISEGAKEAGLSHHELKESIHAVAKQFGGLADVGLWLNPMTAAIAATLFMVDKLKETFKQLNEVVETLALTEAAIDSAKVKAFADALREAAASTAALITEQDTLDAAYARGDTAMENRIKQYGAEKDAVMQVEAAKEAAFEAEINRQLKFGQISPARAAEMKDEAKLDLESMRGQSDQAKLEEEIKERKNKVIEANHRIINASDWESIQKAKANEASLASKAAGSEEAAKQAESGPFTMDYTDWSGAKSTFNGTAETLKKKIGDLKENEQDAEADPKAGSVIAGRYKHDADELTQVLAGQEKHIENLKAIAATDKEALEHGKSITEEAKKQFETDREIVRTGQDKIDQLNQQLERQKRITRELERQHALANRSNEAGQAFEEEQHVMSGHGTAAEQIDVHGGDTRRTAAGERGPAANQDAYNTRISAEQILYRMQNQHGRAGQDDMAQIGQIHERILGFLENSQTQGAAPWRQILNRLDALERTQSNQQSQINYNR
ncbi:MAG TPA: hypothetical protein VGO59_11945 [Verrucomicrobiae bacterium]|jgi:hypothetical protein